MNVFLFKLRNKFTFTKIEEMGEKLISQRLDVSDLPRYSIEEWETWEGKWELISGIPYVYHFAPSILHQRITGKLYKEFYNLTNHVENCEVYLPINFKIDEHTVLHPDLVIVNDIKEENDLYLTKIPYVIVEILSEKSYKLDTLTKFKIYEEIGVEYYVVIDPNRKLTEVFQIENKRYKTKYKAENFKFNFTTNIFNINFDFSKIWK